MGELAGVSLKSTEIKQTLLQEYKPDNWEAFESAVLTYLRQELKFADIETLTMDIANSAHPGPLVIKFNINSEQPITAAILKQALRR